MSETEYFVAASFTNGFQSQADQYICWMQHSTLTRWKTRWSKGNCQILIPRYQEDDFRLYQITRPESFGNHPMVAFALKQSDKPWLEMFYSLRVQSIDHAERFCKQFPPHGYEHNRAVQTVMVKDD